MKAKIRIRILPRIIMGVLLMLAASCKKDNNNNGQVSDIDGNTYRTVTIGTQEWMAENLKTTSYNDGSPIPLVTDSIAWINLNTPGYCWYRNDAANKNTYGALYNWFTINTGKLAPTGWHVASDAEWAMLTDYLGGQDAAGGMLKESGTAHWMSPNDGADNRSGFSALPGGYRNNIARFGYIGNDGAWWSATQNIVTHAWQRHLFFYSGKAYRYSTEKTSGFSIRCVKDK